MKTAKSVLLLSLLVITSSVFAHNQAFLNKHSIKPGAEILWQPNFIDEDVISFK